MKDIKDVLLFLQKFDKNYMFDLEHNNNLFFVSEVLRPEMNRRIMNKDLK